jgi:peptidoglycan/xylan/chitin deacetylase (PgdA/CDA1 family)
VRRVTPLFLLGALFTAIACAQDPDAPASPTPAAPVVLTRGSTVDTAVALVFEVRAADVTPGAMAEVLAALREVRVRASFAITGRWAEANGELTRAIAADGHQIVNAGYDGTSFTGQSTGQRSLTAEQRALQLSRTETSLYRVTNRTTRPFFRPPLGDLDASVERDAAANGYHLIVAGSLDARQAVDAPALLVRVERAVAGDVILLSAAERSPAGAALDDVIAALRAAGFAFATLAEMFSP